MKSIPSEERRKCMEEKEENVKCRGKGGGMEEEGKKRDKRKGVQKNIIQHRLHVNEVP